MQKAEALLDKIEAATKNFAKGRYWKHYKGGIYEFLDLAVDTDDGELRVRYRRVDGPGYNYAIGENRIEYVRPLREWFEDVHPEPGVFIPRFIKVSKVEVWQERP